MAQSQQLLSSGFQSTTAALGGGTLTFRYGNTVDQGVSLSEINGGQGFTPGEIRITDRSGASAVINLSNAQNINDVVQAINSAGTIDVTASTDDGHIVLTDNTRRDRRESPSPGGRTAARRRPRWGSRTSTRPQAPAATPPPARISSRSPATSSSRAERRHGRRRRTRPRFGRYQLHPARRHAGHDRPLGAQRRFDPGRRRPANHSQSGGKLQASRFPSGRAWWSPTRPCRKCRQPRSRSPMPPVPPRPADLGLVGSTSGRTVTGSQILRAAWAPCSRGPERRHGRADELRLRRNRLHAARRHFGHDRSLRPIDPGRRHPADQQPKRRQPASLHFRQGPGGHRHDRERCTRARSRSPMPPGSTAASDLGLVGQRQQHRHRHGQPDPRRAEHRAALRSQRRSGAGDLGLP